MSEGRRSSYKPSISHEAASENAPEVEDEKDSLFSEPEERKSLI